MHFDARSRDLHNFYPLGTIDSYGEIMLKRLIHRAIRKCGYDLVPFQSGRTIPFPSDFTLEDRNLYQYVYPFTQTSPERVQTLSYAVKYIVKNQIEGAIVECGVWKGGSMMVVARTLMSLGEPTRELFLFDTFEGMSAPTPEDVDFEGKPAQHYFKSNPNFNRIPLDEVKTNLQSTHYPQDKIHYVKGKVEDSLPRQAPQKIALLRLDTDWYQSTRHELIHLFPRVEPYGIVLIDDYGHFKGAQQAVDEYLATLSMPIFLARIDYTGRIFVKPPASE